VYSLVYGIGGEMNKRVMQELDPNVTTIKEFSTFARGMVENLHHAIRVEEGKCPALVIFEEIQPLACHLMKLGGVDDFESLPPEGDLPEGIVEELMKLKESHYDPYMAHLVTS
jgi:hypothetical protein